MKFSIKDFFSNCDQIRRKLKRLGDYNIDLLLSYMYTSKSVFSQYAEVQPMKALTLP